MQDDLKVYVTDADIRAACDAWERAREQGASPQRIAELRRGLELLWRAQAAHLAWETRRRLKA